MLPDKPRARLLAALAAACLVILPVRPGMAFMGYDARYSVATTGIEIGRANLLLEPAEDGAALGFTFENDSLLGLVDSSLTRLRASLRRAGRHYMPDFYTALFEKEDRSREIDATFGEDGRMVTFKLVKRGRVRVDRVPEGLDADTVDPLTALLRARTWLENAVEGDAMPLAIFDGRKRYAATLRYFGPVQTSTGGESVAAHRVTVRYRLSAELDEDEGSWLDVEEARERELDMLVSADGRYVPLRVTGSFNGTPLAAVLAADCPAPPGCAAN